MADILSLEGQFREVLKHYKIDSALHTEFVQLLLSAVERDRNARRVAALLTTPWKEQIGNQFAIAGRPDSLLITDEHGQRLHIEWPEKPTMVQSKILTNLKGIPDKDPIPTELFDAVRSWWGEMNAAALTKGEQHGDG